VKFPIMERSFFRSPVSAALDERSHFTEYVFMMRKSIGGSCRLYALRDENLPRRTRSMPVIHPVTVCSDLLRGSTSMKYHSAKSIGETFDGPEL